MRISDWSSDVCSYDLEEVATEVGGLQPERLGFARGGCRGGEAPAAAPDVASRLPDPDREAAARPVVPVAHLLTERRARRPPLARGGSHPPGADRRSERSRVGEGRVRQGRSRWVAVTKKKNTNK